MARPIHKSARGRARRSIVIANTGGAIDVPALAAQLRLSNLHGVQPWPLNQSTPSISSCLEQRET